MTSLPPVKRFDWKNLAVRAGSALVLAPAALAAVWFGGPLFLVLIAVAVALLSIEWAGMCDTETPGGAAVVIAAAILIGIFGAYLDHPWIGWALVALGAVTGGVFTLVRGKIDRPADIAFGILYIGAPAVALVWMRTGIRPDDGPKWTILLLAVVWAADIFAFLVGNLLKGPKLWPRFSPNKTWTGFVGGLFGGALVGGLITLIPFPKSHGPSFIAALAIGFLAALAGMAGDLWESMLKRRFGVKDSGDLIPGHGGLLDRVDGLMFAALVIAAARLSVHLGLRL